ncbi:trypsin-like peptidase domain-containing protein [Sphingopyxis sp.]|uniref:trypsin-like peptidase domain-containing protein n=1 Tax=Sphingopyxis sp. TaxID=1908224 RepID=UPI002FCBBCD4
MHVTVKAPKRIEIDPYSSVAVRLTMMRDDLVLAHGSGFLWAEGHQLGVVTAWHCLTGTHPETRRSLNPEKGARPNKIAVSLLMRDLGEGTITIWLHGPESGDPMWRVHPLGSAEIDLAVIWVPNEAMPADTMTTPANALTDSPLILHVGTDLFILGYPRNLHRFGLPIWKRASLATDIDATLEEPGKRHLLVDTASRDGMSGALVIARNRGIAHFENKNMIAGGEYTRLVGVYTGRVGGADDMAAQIGIVWPMRYVRELISDGVPDDFV